MVNTKNLASVRAFFTLHKNEIMQQYGAHGIAIGKQNPKDDEYVIVVYLDNKKQLPTTPVILEGIPLKFEVTGPFTLQK